ncbi:MAG: hypothetical protein AAGH17_03625 [Pseudomonadota bacterium]
MPDLIRLYIQQCIIGFILSAIFVVMLFAFNIMNLWHLVTHTQGGWLAAFLLFVFNGIVFSGVQFGIAIMRMKDDDDDDDDDRGMMIREYNAVPVRVNETRPR